MNFHAEQRFYVIEKKKKKFLCQWSFVLSALPIDVTVIKVWHKTKSSIFWSWPEWSETISANPFICLLSHNSWGWGTLLGFTHSIFFSYPPPLPVIFKYLLVSKQDRNKKWSTWCKFLIATSDSIFYSIYNHTSI